MFNYYTMIYKYCIFYEDLFYLKHDKINAENKQYIIWTFYYQMQTISETPNNTSGHWGNDIACPEQESYLEIMKVRHWWVFCVNEASYCIIDVTFLNEVSLLKQSLILHYEVINFWQGIICSYNVISSL